MRETLVTIILTLAVSAAPALCGGVEPFTIPDAVLINLTQDDLNRMLRDAFHAEGIAELDGSARQAGRGVYDLSYRADLSEPFLELEDDGRASLTLGIRRADVRIGLLEKRIWHRNARCENAGLRIAGDPVGVTLMLRFGIEDDGVQILPQEVQLSNAGGLRPVKPTRCTNTLLPRWLLWWLGKPGLRRQIDRLDDLLLARARKGASDLRERGGLLQRHWRMDAGAGELYFHPQSLETDGGALRVTLSGSNVDRPVEPAPSPSWAADLPERSYVAVSEALVNRILRDRLGGLERDPQRPTGGLRKLFRSSAIYTLVPGLRDLDGPRDLAYAIRLGSAPEIEFETDGASDAARIRLRLHGLEVDLREAEVPGRLLGTLRVDSASVVVVPYANLLGGISFRLVENDWTVSSRGIEFDDAVLEATLQELVFGELFETRYEPVAGDAFRVGTTKLPPRSFRLVGDHLVIGLGDSSQANR